MAKKGVKLGKRYSDKITGFEGVATARSEYLAGCARVLLEAKGKDDVVKEYWFDEIRLEPCHLTKKQKKEPGGPGRTPTCRDPQR